MSEVNRTAEPAPEQQEQDQALGGEELDGDGKRGRRRSRTMSRKEIARELRRQRAFGLMDPELDATMREMEGELGLADREVRQALRRIEKVGGRVATVRWNEARAG